MAIDDEGIPIVAGRQSVGVDDYNEQDSEIVRPESMESGQIKCPGGRIKHRAQRPKSYKRKKMWPAGPKSADLDKDNNFMPTRKRGRPAGSKSAKSKMGQKPALAYSSSNSEDERDEDDDIDPARKRRLPAGSKFAKNNKDDKFVPTRKRGRPAGSKSAKIKMGQKPAFTRIGSTNSEGKRGKYGVSDPTVPDANGGKEHARVQGRCGPAFKRASGVQEKSPGEYPSFTKCMVPSNVLRVFWLHLSSDFCRTYLPKRNARMTLEDENGQRDYANYLSGSYGLSGGWRGFAIDHNLKVGDTVVFELVMPTKFKVYIRRANDSTTTDDVVKSKEDPGVTTRENSSAPGGDADNQANEEAVDDADGMRSPDPGTEDSDGVPCFKNLNSFIDGLLISAELFPDCLRWTYYELCLDRKALLHRNLLKNIRPALVMAVIMETTNIAKGITAAASREDLAAWKKILESFELLGMDVGFLRKHVDDLLGITVQSSTDQPSVECEGYKEVKLEKDRAAEKMGALNSKMAAVNDAMRAVDVEMKEMKSSVKKYVQAVRKMVTAPW